METKDVVMIILIIAAVIAVAYFTLSKKQSSSQAPSASSQSSITPPSLPSNTPSPTSSAQTQPFIVQTYSVSGTMNLVIPLLSETFIVAVYPQNSVSLTAWFNLNNSQQQDQTSLVVIDNPVTITQPTVILTSDGLKQNNVPYEGYPYLVLSTYGTATIVVSFYKK